MAKPVFTFAEAAGFSVVKFEIPGGVTTPAELANATAEISGRLPGPRVVLLNGRGPVWGYGMLIHAAHPTPAIGVFDPRLGYIVVTSHDEAYAMGSMIPDPEAAQ